jgi:Phytanoyl-CoA dioxygenase (PhyH)/SEC-C motif
MRHLDYMASATDVVAGAGVHNGPLTTSNSVTSDLGDSTKAVRAWPGELPMESIVAISADESTRGQLHPATEHAAHAAFRKHGCVLLRGVFPPAVIDAMYRDYVSQYGALDNRGMLEQATKPMRDPIILRSEARYQITPRMSGAFGAPGVFGNPLLLRFLAPLLGDDMHLGSFTLVVSHPGASLQQTHRDHPYLFAETGVGQNLPVYAVNVVVPLIDVDTETGPTGVWPGSHQWPENTIPQPDTVSTYAIQRGDCMLLDYRTLHTGLPNQSARVRPNLYMVYTRFWFFDQMITLGACSVNMSHDDYRKLPDSTRPLLFRALSRAINRHEVDLVPRALGPMRNPNDPSSWGKVGRNEPCPCGSGKRYKQCHGRLA